MVAVGLLAGLPQQATGQESGEPGDGDGEGALTALMDSALAGCWLKNAPFGSFSSEHVFLTCF